jgi:hypothetical protein
VRSQRSKKYGFLATAMKAIKNAVKISDWANALSEFEGLSRGMSRAAALLETEGYPRNFIKMYGLSWRAHVRARRLMRRGVGWH